MSCVEWWRGKGEGVHGMMEEKGRIMGRRAKGKGRKPVPGPFTAEAAACPNHMAPESGVQGENFTTEHKMALVWHLACQTDSSAVPWLFFFFFFFFLFRTSAVTQQFKTCKSGSSHLCLKAKRKKKKNHRTNMIHL